MMDSKFYKFINFKELERALAGWEKDPEVVRSMIKDYQERIELLAKEGNSSIIYFKNYHNGYQVLICEEGTNGELLENSRTHPGDFFARTIEIKCGEVREADKK